MDEKLPSEGIRPVFPSHPHQTVIGYPVSANTRQPIQNRRPATSASAAIESSNSDPVLWFCLWLIFVVFVSVMSTAIIVSYVPEFPSISIKSMSMTAITNASDTQVKASLEMVFDPVENINKHNSIIYDRVNVTAFDVKEGLFSDATFEQRGSDKRAVVVRMENVTVDVREYEQHIYGRYGVSYLNFEIAGFIRIEGGKWPVKRTTSIRAVCDQVSKKVVFPLYQWNQTQTLHFEANICEVDGDWESFKYKCGSTLGTFVFVFLLVSICLCVWIWVFSVEVARLQ